MPPETKTSSITERHIQTAAVIMIMGFIAWGGMTIQRMEVAMGKIETSVDSMIKKVDRLENNRDRYANKTDVARQIQQLRDWNNNLTLRITRLETLGQEKIK